MKNVTVSSGKVIDPPQVPAPAAAIAAAQAGIPPGAFPEPSPAEMSANLAKAAARWIGAGFPVVSQTIYDTRSDACQKCSFWDGKARLGLGKCKAPGCGCTGLKRWLATETCPHPAGSRWPEGRPSSATVDKSAK